MGVAVGEVSELLRIVVGPFRDGLFLYSHRKMLVGSENRRASDRFHDARRAFDPCRAARLEGPPWLSKRALALAPNLALDDTSSDRRWGIFRSDRADAIVP